MDKGKLLERGLMALDSMARRCLTAERKPEALNGTPPFMIPEGGKVNAWRGVSGGVQARIGFPNGYEASIIRHSFSYGSERGLWELAVCRGDDGSLVYDTPITDDVEGNLTEGDVNALLVRIAALSEARVMDHTTKSVLLATLRARALSGDGMALDALMYAAKEEAIRDFTETLNRALGYPLPPLAEQAAS